MYALLHTLQPAGTAPAGYHAALLAAFHVSPPRRSGIEWLGTADVSSSASPGVWALVEPLTEREHEVLALLADGASNQAIADRLVISLATAKKHVNNILGKLHAQNRTEAVARAREARWLT